MSLANQFAKNFFNRVYVAMTLFLFPLPLAWFESSSEFLIHF